MRRPVSTLVVRLLWPRFVDVPEFGAKQALSCWFAQKIIGINRAVPWPVHWSSVIKAPEKIQRGTRTPGLSSGVYLDGRNGIIFGRNVWLGPQVKIISMNHDVNQYERYLEAGPIRLGDHCWVGAGAIILPGVVLGEHTVVGAGAIVTKSYPEGNQVLAGNPARVIKALEPYRGRI